jgi:hypothetical protein
LPFRRACFRARSGCRVSEHVADTHEVLLEDPAAPNQLLGAGGCPSTAASAARTSRVMDELLHEYRRAARPRSA